MIVESIRLQHIKSYGQGPAGSGVTVNFQPGVNRIAGVNGCGKTTIVEALGYALFSALPVFEENFKAETYLLAHGAKAGEIDVTFGVDGSSYRLDRPRTKPVNRWGPHHERRVHPPAAHQAGQRQGPGGSGVTVSFQPGVNRIAGVNGCGKTTIVEALGYALFSALPVFEENFKAETYLSRPRGEGRRD